MAPPSRCTSGGRIGVGRRAVSRLPVARSARASHCPASMASVSIRVSTGTSSTSCSEFRWAAAVPSPTASSRPPRAPWRWSTRIRGIASTGARPAGRSKFSRPSSSSSRLSTSTVPISSCSAPRSCSSSPHATPGGSISTSACHGGSSCRVTTIPASSSASSAPSPGRWSPWIRSVVRRARSARSPCS